MRPNSRVSNSHTPSVVSDADNARGIIWIRATHCSDRASLASDTVNNKVASASITDATTIRLRRSRRPVVNGFFFLGYFNRGAGMG